MTLSDEKLKELEAALVRVHKSYRVGVDGHALAVREDVLNTLTEYARAFSQIAPLLKEMMEKREKCTTEGEWFASAHLGSSGLCQVDDGLEYGMYQIVCEWHEGRFIATAANKLTEIGRIINEN